jgi:hypothetical protein
VATSEAYQKWYERNRIAFNQRRRVRYANDADYRERVVNNTRKARSTRQTSPQVSRTFLYIGEAAKEIGRDVQTIRAWEYRGLIPRSVNTRGFRVYSTHQVQLLKELAEFLSTFVRGNEEQFKAQLEEVRNRLHNHWEA